MALFFQDSPIKTFPELMEALRKKGHESIIEKLQSHPYIIMLRIGHSCVVMGHGETSNEALKDLFEMALLLLVKGYNFRTHFNKPFDTKQK